MGPGGAKHRIWLRHRPIIRPRSSKKHMYQYQYITFLIYVKMTSWFA